MHTKGVLCASCDIACALTAHVDQGRVVKISQSRNPLLKDNICMKGVYAPKGFAHPDRVLHPLKRVGERGSGQWERVSWDDAMADIASRLKKIADEHGPAAQSLFTRKDTLLNRPVKAVARFCVGQFHKYTGYMKDDMIDSDIGFTAEELNRNQYGSDKPDERK